MKLNRLETHDRFEWFKNNQFDLQKCIDFFSNERPFGDHCFYLFIINKHSLGEDEKISLIINGQYSPDNCPDALMILHARLGKPLPSPNTNLIKIYPGKEYSKRIWSLPEREYWDQYVHGKMCEDSFILQSIISYQSNPELMAELEDDDVKSYAEFTRTNDFSVGKKTKITLPIFGSKINA